MLEEQTQYLIYKNEYMGETPRDSIPVTKKKKGEGFEEVINIRMSQQLYQKGIILLCQPILHLMTNLTPPDLINKSFYYLRT